LTNNSNKQQSITPKPILSNKTNQNAPQKIPQPQPHQQQQQQQSAKKSAFKDSIDDIDDMLSDFEKKYSSNNNNINSSNRNIKAGINNNNNTNINMIHPQKPIVKNPVNAKRASHANIRDSIINQFKDDPLFADLLQSNALNVPNSNTNNNNKQPNMNNNLNISGSNLRRNSHFPLDTSNNPNNKIDSNMQKKKFDDLFNNLEQKPALNSNTYNNNKVIDSNKKKELFDDLLFEDENNLKPTNKIASLANFHGANNNTNFNQYNAIANAKIISNNNSDLSSEAANRRRMINKSARKDILEEIFGEDLFNSFSNPQQPTQSKAQPQVSNNSKNSIISNNNKYEDIFSQNNTNNKNGKAKDPFDFGLNYEPTFLQDDGAGSNSNNQYNTRRSRYLPSGKRDQNSAKSGWNQTQFKINNININNNGLDGLVHRQNSNLNNNGNNNSNNNNSYVPSFVGSGKATDKKSIDFSLLFFLF
jgi:hypothetical protein